MVLNVPVLGGQTGDLQNNEGERKMNSGGISCWIQEILLEKQAGSCGTLTKAFSKSCI